MRGVAFTAGRRRVVTISRNGVLEQLFLDQSQPAPGAPGAVRRNRAWWRRRPRRRRGARAWHLPRPLRRSSSNRG